MAKPKSEAAATRTWDGNAATYRWQERFESRALSAAIRLADTGPADRLVDLATGTGIVLRALAEARTRPADALGVDRSVGMLERVGPLPPGWRVLRGDARALPLADGSADVVTCSYLLHLLGSDDRAAVLGEARRLLNSSPEPRLVATTVWVDRGTVGCRLLDPVLRGIARAAPARLGGLKPLDPTADLAAAGFLVTDRVVLPRGGYPSLVLRARPV